MADKSKSIRIEWQLTFINKRPRKFKAKRKGAYIMKKFSTLTVDELKKVYDANDVLQQNVVEDYEESQMDYVGDILDVLSKGLTNWEVGYGSCPWVRYDSERDLFQAALDSCRDFGFLPDDVAEKVKYYLTRCDVLDEMEYENKHYGELESYIEHAAEDVAEEIVSAFKGLLDYSEDDILDYFLSFYSDERMNENEFYVDGNYILYEHVEYEKCYSSAKKRRAAC